MSNSDMEDIDGEIVITQYPGASREYFYVRSCEQYKEFYNLCRSFKARLYQLYIYGEKLDCQDHQTNYMNCIKFRQTKDLKTLDSIVRWEQNMIEARNKTVEQNKIWRLRKCPPEDFDKPLPGFIAKRVARINAKID